MSMAAPDSSIFASLPSELISRIFLDLALDSPSDIAACRLVSHRFNEHSSPFILPCVVFSRQLGALTKLSEVLCHPYFRRHVTRLIYDSSEYAESTAMDWYQYVEDCGKAPRDLEYSQQTGDTRQNIVARERLGRFSNKNALPPGPGGDEIELDSPTPRNGFEGVAESNVQSSNAYRRGCHTTFGSYVQSQVDQQWIRNERIDLNILAAAFDQFPRLRDIAFTDYRGLAREGESYDTCCRRLFGRSLEPQHAGVSGQATPSGDCLFSLLEIAAEAPSACIDTLAIGPHSFEYTGEDIVEVADPNHPQNPQYLDISAFEGVQLEPEDRLLAVLGQLRNLRLALCYSGCRSDEKHMREQLRKFLRASTPQLHTLTLHMIYLFWGGVREVPKVDNDTRFEVFGSIVSPLHIPFLRSLSLRRWIFSTRELRVFLLKHASTLRDLHLLGCLCGDDEDGLARWGGENLNLDGVELDGFLSAVDTVSANPRNWTQVDSVQWRSMDPTVSGRNISVLEALWLAGRPNIVERQQKVEIIPGPGWWKRPAHYEGIIDNLQV
jgi:hypothetical protein